jgi:saccharopine dehydrogenase-like NADP-dependent oxidoreductase
MKTLVLGGYGNFGARICRALAADPASNCWSAGATWRRGDGLRAIAGRQCARRSRRRAGARSRAGLGYLGVELVIHTAGPFQNQDYRVPQAVAAAGAHYIDLADGRRFVCDFPAALDAAFRACGPHGRCGASTVPALSSAVVDHLAAGWQGIRSIDICIAPAQGAPRGEATLAGVLAYCGEPIRVWQDGRWVEQPGWANPVKVQFARMKPRRGALCDIPDLELFPSRYAGVQSVMFRAALEVGLAQRAFAFMAFLHRVGLLPAPQKLAPLLHSAGRVFDALGTRWAAWWCASKAPMRGARQRAAPGTSPPTTTTAPRFPAWPRSCWHAGSRAARPCRRRARLRRLLTLPEFEPEFARWGMVTDIDEEAAAATDAQGHGAPAL